MAGLSACASTTVPVPPCCYEGPVTITRLKQLTITTTSGSSLSIQQALPGFKPEKGFITRALPVREAESQDIIYASLEPLLPLYDANADGTLETPEITLLYLREALRGLGVNVARIGNPTPVRALAIPSADTGGLVTYVQSQQGRMSPEARQIFADLTQLGNDILTRGSEGGSDDQGNDFSK